MTPATIIESAKRRYNAENDSFFSDDELFGLIYEAQLEIQQETKITEATDTSITTVNGTRTYSMPSNWIDLKRVEWNGIPLELIDFDLDDQITGDRPDTSSTAEPSSYFLWNETIYLRPVPGEAQTLKLIGHKQPDDITAGTDTLLTPSMFHYVLIDYVVSEMAFKDTNTNSGLYYAGKFQKGVEKIKRWVARRRRGGGFAVVKSEELNG